jgi:hypothetical protein
MYVKFAAKGVDILLMLECRNNRATNVVFVEGCPIQLMISERMCTDMSGKAGCNVLRCSTLKILEFFVGCSLPSWVTIGIGVNNLNGCATPASLSA